jgi:hypothetical protein
MHLSIVVTFDLTFKSGISRFERRILEAKPAVKVLVTRALFVDAIHGFSFLPAFGPAGGAIELL